jgi:hypothetical protein
MSDQKV